MRCVVAHLRLISPNRIAQQNSLCLRRQEGGYVQGHRSVSRSQIYLADCESLQGPIKLANLQTLKDWMSSITLLCSNRKNSIALWLSLDFFEKAYHEWNLKVRFLLLVMSVEALFSDDHTRGKNIWTERVIPFLGTERDLYAEYARCDSPLIGWLREGNSSAEYGDLPVLKLGSVVNDIRELRNKIAHGMPTPDKFSKVVRRPGLSCDTVLFAGQLVEAVSTTLRLCWKRIVEENLRDIFVDKSKMPDYFRSLKKCQS